MEWSDLVQEGFKDRFGEGREDYRLARYSYNADMGRDAEGSRLQHTLATNPTFVTMKDLARRLIGREADGYQRKREEMGMGLSKSPAKATGQVLGTIANDITQDSTRSLWWLLNAPQAVGNVTNETILAGANPELFRHKAVSPGGPGTYIPAHQYTGALQYEKGPNGTQVEKPPIFYSQDELLSPKLNELVKQRRADHDLAVSQGLISNTGQLKKGIQKQFNKEAGGMVYTRRKYNPGDVAALGIPTGIAINAGIGLLNPLGGSGGYSAVLPSDDDPTKTSNVIGEIAAKYILGRTGNLLPYAEFSKHRPDVDVGEYNRYKAFKYDKEGDFNPFDDGQITLPTGVAKFTTEGIHGPELQFLGRSLPVTTALIPYLGALAGGVAGAYQPTYLDEKTKSLKPIEDKINKRPIRRGLIGGMAGLGIGTATGLIVEEMRRRSGSNNVQLEGGNAEGYLR